MNILVIRFSAMGDVALTLPVIRGVLEENPDLHITFLTKKPTNQIFNSIPRLTVLTPNLKKQHKGFLGLFRLYLQLRKKTKFHCVVDLHGVLRSYILSFFFRTTFKKIYTIDKGREEKKAFLRKELHKPLKHTTQRYIDTFQKAGIKAKLSKLPCVEFSQKVKDEIDGMFMVRNHIQQKEKVIGIAPFAKHRTKIWGVEKVVQFIEMARGECKCNVFLFGGKEEIQKLDKVANQFDNVVNVAGEFSLEEELYLMSEMQFMITMDSANMHLATLVGTKVVSIWGGTHPAMGFGPLGNNNDYIIQVPRDNLTCRPCSVFGNRTCHIAEKHKCMNLITPMQVFQLMKGQEF